MLTFVGMNISLKEIAEGIIDVVNESIDELVTAEYTFEFIYDSKKAKEYPKLSIIANQNITIGERTNTIPLLLRFSDVAVGKNNTPLKDKEIKSDMIQAASKLFDILQTKGYFDGELSLTAEPFDHELNNGLSGIDVIANFVTEKPCYEV